ncbi:gluconate 2-dehydrogenase subunit 3 family protein [Parendozoicomonas sp. Alg238-R29]|uniref:gluconate 2-dehydrogenase subunit 3 family protein n=1 Tax=Parendozoicomonas sp. Alg238-R29 TaxID=2993446 RepID=UPI00248E5064|nr:gluconate 2-dehydrogenase subunit 3 family protein [Parendozoicomonas sp. Alg238-R29]
MNRRWFLATTALAVSGFATSVIARLGQDQNAHLALGPSITEQPQSFFSDDQRALVAQITETIIPRTDTPGAIDAGVPVFVESMVAEWLVEKEKNIFLQGLEQVTRLSQQDYQKSFTELDASQRTRILEILEKEASDSPWYNFGNVQRDFVEGAPFICQIKELTIFGFYSSEVGAKETLRHNPMPMSFDGEYGLDEGESTWSTIRVM